MLVTPRCQGVTRQLILLMISVLRCSSTFIPIHCKSCSSPIGRIYQTTPKDLDHLRNQYCLDMEHIRSYQVGSEDGMQTLPAEEVLGIPTAKVLQQGIHKIESVVLMLLERLTLLEKEVKGNKANMEDDETNLTATGSDSARETQKESDSAKQNRKRRK